jgi:hypothetical protein
MRTEYQLMLPQLLWDERYTAQYAAHCVDPNQYVILDNGAAEGEDWDFDKLLVVADAMRVDELVIPDVLGNAEQTRTLAMECLEYFEHFEPPFKLGVVMQGKSPSEGLDMIAKLLVDAPVRPSVVYIPRLFITEDFLKARIYLAEWLHSLHPDLEIHFLGMSGLFPSEPYAMRQVRFVRGIDTSLPFNYALAGRRVIGQHNISRPENYFDLQMNWEQQDTAVDNIVQMQHWLED